ncbi:MAG: 16S rRNA (cytidine(1402)-2'-O)-methyltransferase [Candidatus Nomurabacteria bacterium]|nr:16S rRNA (cytidine(1402)-2'-O)-methyltransferase [Candidatus Nomurabacteria bacterium]
MNESGTLYVLATPIGNLGDISVRAVEILKSVDAVICEDTRVTKKLLNHLEISKPAYSYHANTSAGAEDKILKMLAGGQTLALVSDAGTPAISDPGVHIIARVYGELADVSVIPIPGASAVITALSACGIPASEYTFLGFLPHKKGRQKLFTEIAESKRTMVFYESVHRIEKTLASLTEVLDDNRMVVVARELTKIYEEFVRGTAAEVQDYFVNNPDKIRGEFVVIVGGK